MHKTNRMDTLATPELLQSWHAEVMQEEVGLS